MSAWYVALGDSMSIDLYPRLDLMARKGEGTGPEGVGAASLFHRNDDDRWPEFAGRDLAHRLPGIQRLDVCADGATIGHALEFQLPKVPGEVAASARVVTLTAGGNDLLGGLFDGRASLEQAARRAMDRYPALVEWVLDAFPAATVLLTTVYDPTDGTGILPGLSDMHGPLPMRLLGEFNDTVRATAAGHDRAALADVHGEFMGHGLSADADSRWYWAPNPIEPGAAGASEIRRAWLAALERVG